MVSSASARVDWRVERAYEGGGSELEFGLGIIALIILVSLYIGYFSYNVCKGCKTKVRGKAKYCTECGMELPKI